RRLGVVHQGQLVPPGGEDVLQDAGAETPALRSLDIVIVVTAGFLDHVRSSLEEDLAGVGADAAGLVLAQLCDERAQHDVVAPVPTALLAAELAGRVVAEERDELLAPDDPRASVVAAVPDRVLGEEPDEVAAASIDAVRVAEAQEPDLFDRQEVLDRRG